MGLVEGIVDGVECLFFDAGIACVRTMEWEWELFPCEGWDAGGVGMLGSIEWRD